jgi:hypothetical protein
MEREIRCPDCDSEPLTRRHFVQAVGATAAAVSAASLPSAAFAADDKPQAKKPETLAKKLFGTLTPEQKKEVHFDWDHKREDKPLRMQVSNNWINTKPKLNDPFFTDDQRDSV